MSCIWNVKRPQELTCCNPNRWITCPEVCVAWCNYSKFGVKFLNLSKPLLAHLQSWNGSASSVPARIGDGSLPRLSLTLFLLVQRVGNCRTPEAKAKEVFFPFISHLRKRYGNSDITLPAPISLPKLDYFAVWQSQASKLEQLPWSERKTQRSLPATLIRLWHDLATALKAEDVLAL